MKRKAPCLVLTFVAMPTWGTFRKPINICSFKKTKSRNFNFFFIFFDRRAQRISQKTQRILRRHITTSRWSTDAIVSISQNLLFVGELLCGHRQPTSVSRVAFPLPWEPEKRCWPAATTVFRCYSSSQCYLRSARIPRSRRDFLSSASGLRFGSAKSQTVLRRGFWFHR